jgi:hypothetical protein
MPALPDWQHKQHNATTHALQTAVLLLLWLAVSW